MIKEHLRSIALWGILSLMVSCNRSIHHAAIDINPVAAVNESQLVDSMADSPIMADSISELRNHIDLSVMNFVQMLKEGEQLGAFFNDRWVLIYHEDNRCDGSTDGQTDHLKYIQIDTIIKIQVNNNGDGWGCDKKAPSSFELEFDIKKQVAFWDRFEIQNCVIQDKHIIDIHGGGESDYLKLHYNDRNLIDTLNIEVKTPDKYE